MSKIAKVLKFITLLISFGFVGLSSIEVISGQLGDISLFGFNLTETQQQITHYITSGGMALLGGLGIGINEFLNKKLKESRELTNSLLEKFLTLTEQYKTLEKDLVNTKKEISLLRSDLSNELEFLTVKFSEFNDLIRADLNTKLSNPLIDRKAKELIERALGNEKQDII